MAFIALPSILTFTQQDLSIEEQLRASRDFLAFDSEIDTWTIYTKGAYSHVIVD